MDSSNQQINPLPQQQPSTAGNPLTGQRVDPVTPPAGYSGSKNMLIWLIVGAVVLILVAGGVYLYLKRSIGQQAQTTTTKTQAQENLNTELNSLDVESEGSDFAEVDKDLQSI